ncbi:conserved uncharacterized protein, DUF218 [Desulfosarcina variabilis str. Montpellier]|uniref:YdcF family protein n=1 Tax=Desulfosarcina variabilis TaxID=2300 RepID=UPI003AFA581C
MLFTFKKLVTPFILPPGIFILFLLIIGLVSLKRRHFRLGLLNLLLGIALYALSISLVANRLVQGLEADFSFEVPVTGDVIVVLGGGTIQGVPDLTGIATPTPIMMGRIVTAVRLYRQTGLPIIITGGRWSDADISEATVAARFMMDLGVPETAIIKEEMARDTFENARFTAAICRQEGFTRPIVLTTAYHLKRVLIAFNSVGIPGIPFPANFFGNNHQSGRWHRLLPRASTLYLTTCALHEYLGIWYYQLTK